MANQLRSRVAETVNTNINALAEQSSASRSTTRNNNISMAIDRRVRLRPKPLGENYVYGDLGGTQPTLLSILRTTNGMVWNITPIISESHTVNYETIQPIHTNAGFNNYKNTPNTQLNVQGTFVVNNGLEAMYLLAVINFLRSVTKMDFGRQTINATSPDIGVVGAPPPILLFSGYGKYMYNDIPVIVKNVNYNFADDVDYILVPLDSSNGEFFVSSANINEFTSYVNDGSIVISEENRVYVPQKLNITVQLEVQPTPSYMSKQFNLNSFKRGELLRNGGII